MTFHSDRHECEICGAYGFHGVRQPDKEYLWYCLLHLPATLPPQKFEAKVPEGQMTMDLGHTEDPKEIFRRIVQSNRNWSVGYKAYVKLMVKSGVEAMAEDWRKEAQPWIGWSPSPNMIGAACNELKAEGYLEYVRHAAPRDPKSHMSKKTLWRRTNLR